MIKLFYDFRVTPHVWASTPEHVESATFHHYILREPICVSNNNNAFKSETKINLLYMVTAIIVHYMQVVGKVNVIIFSISTRLIFNQNCFRVITLVSCLRIGLWRPVIFCRRDLGFDCTYYTLLK